MVEQERGLLRRSGINDDVDLRPGHRRFSAGFDFV
jgi:hypothetical protein